MKREIVKERSAGLSAARGYRSSGRPHVSQNGRQAVSAGCGRRRTVKRLTGFVLSVIMAAYCFSPAFVSYGAETELPELAAQSAVLINADTGEILYDKYKDWPRYPASTTKVMTAILALENLDPDQVCTISHNAAYTEGSRIFLLEGEQVTVEQLLYAMLLASANDAAIALAEACAGTTEAFAQMMNEKAAELGAENTNFVTPNGLPDESHVTSAQDMALFAQEAMKNEMFRRIVSTYEYVIPPTNLQAEQRLIHNTNRLLYDTETTLDIGGVARAPKYDGILGIKTGYTNAAHSCLVAAAERDGMTLIGVVFKSEPDALYADMIKLLDFGFDNFRALDLGYDAGSVVGKIGVDGGSKRNVDVTVNSDVKVMLERMNGDEEHDASDFELKIEGEDLKAPFDSGTEAGRLVVYRDSEAVMELPVYTAESVDVSPARAFFSSITPLRVLGMIVAAAVIAGIIAYIIFALKIRRRAQAEAESRRAERERRRREEAARPDDLAVKYQTDRQRRQHRSENAGKEEETR